MNQQHTPGPWVWKEDITDRSAMPRLDSDAGEVCNFGDCTHYHPTEGTPPNDADMALIAAAPDLLTALEKVWSEGVIPDGFAILQDQVCDAIAKATGSPA